MKKLVDFLKMDVSKLVAWIKKTEPKVIQDITNAINFAEKIKTAINSKEFQTVEEYITKYAPQLGEFESKALPILEEVIGSLLKVESSVVSINSLILTLASMIYNLFNGNTKDISTCVLEVQELFVKS